MFENDYSQQKKAIQVLLGQEIENAFSIEYISQEKCLVKNDQFHKKDLS